MPRSYRCIVLAISGIALLAAAPHEGGEGKAKDPASQQRSQSDLKHIASSLENLSRIPPPDQGCDAGKDDRNSDLCAQWKAADAAADSAWWAMATFFGGLVALAIGAGTLGFAAWAAFWAKEAARHTARGSDAAQQGVRPWLAFADPKLVRLQFGGGDGMSVTVALDLTNFGNSPAIKPRLALGFLFEEERRKEIKEGIMQRLRSDVGLSSNAIYNGETVNRWGDYLQGVVSPPGMDANEFIAHPFVIMFIYVGYQSIGGEYFYVGDEFLFNGRLQNEDGCLYGAVSRVFKGDCLEAT